MKKPKESTKMEDENDSKFDNCEGEIHFENNTWILHKELGEGGFAIVYEGTMPKTKQQCAIKIQKTWDPKVMESFEIEREAYSKIPSHPNILRMIYCGIGKVKTRKDQVAENKKFIALEYAPKRDLISYLAQCPGGFPLPVARYLFKCIIDSLKHIHSHGVAHLDIKPQNILFSENYELKLGDFGLSSSSPCKLTSQQGTDGYIAPEILKGYEYDGKLVDLYAAGIVLFYLVMGNPPFDRVIIPDSLYSMLYRKNYYEFWKRHTQRRTLMISEDFKQLFQKMLANSPHERCYFDEIKVSEFMQDEKYNIASPDECRYFLNRVYQRILKSEDIPKSQKNTKDNYSTNQIPENIVDSIESIKMGIRFSKPKILYGIPTTNDIPLRIESIKEIYNLLLTFYKRYNTSPKALSMLSVRREKGEHLILEGLEYFSGDKSDATINKIKLSVQILDDPNGEMKYLRVFAESGDPLIFRRAVNDIRRLFYPEIPEPSSIPFEEIKKNTMSLPS